MPTPVLDQRVLTSISIGFSGHALASALDHQETRVLGQTYGTSRSSIVSPLNFDVGMLLTYLPSLPPSYVPLSTDLCPPAGNVSDVGIAE